MEDGQPVSLPWQTNGSENIGFFIRCLHVLASPHSALSSLPLPFFPSLCHIVHFQAVCPYCAVCPSQCLSRAPSAPTHTGPCQQPADQSFRTRPLGLVGLLPHYPLLAGQCGYQEAQVPAVCHPVTTQAQAPGLPQSEAKGGSLTGVSSQCKCSGILQGRGLSCVVRFHAGRHVNCLLPLQESDITEEYLSCDD